jgi:PAS domain S-box-containing protein
MYRFFKPPIYEDEEKTRNARLLHLILFMLPPILLLVGLLATLVLPKNGPHWLLFLILSISAILSAIFFNQNRKTRTAGTILILVLWILITVMATTAGGMQAPVINGYLVIVFIAGLVFGGTAGFATAVLCSLTGLGLVVIARIGALPGIEVIHTPISQWVVNSLFLGTVAGLQYITFKYIKDASCRLSQELKERRDTEIALRESEERFRTIFNWVNDAIFIQDPISGAILEVNQKACDIFGYSREVLCSLSIEELSAASSDYTQEMALKRIHLAAEGDPQIFEWKSKDSQGRLFWTEINIRHAIIGKDERMLVTVRDIDERKHAEIALRESENRFRTVFEQAPDYGAIMDLKGNILDINQHACQELGYAREEVLHKNACEIYPEFFNQSEHFQFWEQFSPDDLLILETILRNKAGTNISLDVRLSAIKLGEQRCILVLGRDITQRKQTEQLARLEEKRLQSIIKITQHKSEDLDAWLHFTLDEMVALSDSEFGVIFYFDDEKQEFFNSTLSKNEGIHRIQAPSPMRFPLQVSESGFWSIPVLQNKPIIVNQIPDADIQKYGLPESHQSIHRFMALPVWSDDHVVAVIAIANKAGDCGYTEEDVHQLNQMTDLVWKIIERRQTEIAFKKSEERYRQLVELSQDAVIVTDNLGVVKFANPAAHKIFGYSDQTLVGLDLAETFLPSERHLFYENQAQVSSGVHLHFEREIICKNGAKILADVILTPLSEKECQVIYHDITQQKQNEAELERRVAERTAQLAAANKELESFSYSVSHDLKAPLRGIDGYSQLLDELYSSKLEEEGRFFVHTIRSATLKMAELIDDLLSYSRLERRVMTAVSIELGQFVTQILEPYQEEIETRAVEIRSCLPLTIVQADPEGLSIALRNVIDNAMKFTRKISNPVIVIGVEERDQSCVIWVRDNGVGFDIQYHDRIFEVFQRLQRVEDYPGTGVGLAIARKALLRMGGKIWAESIPDEGTTFFMEIPK